MQSFCKTTGSKWAFSKIDKFALEDTSVHNDIYREFRRDANVVFVTVFAEQQQQKTAFPLTPENL